MSAIQAIIKNTRKLDLANKGSSTVIVNKEILMLTSGLAVPATSSTTSATLLGVANQAISAADALTQVPYIVPDFQDVYIFDTANNSNAGHNGQQMVLTDSVTVNNTGTTNPAGIVVQVDVYGAASDKKILGRFVTL